MPILNRRKDEPIPRRNDTYRAVYQSARWHKYSLLYRKANRLCVICLSQGRTVLSACVDHIVPLKEGGDIWNPANHQALCIACHNTKTVQENKNWNIRE
jgi:5-methylcytosine-specific restriction enzyme A